MKRVTLIMFVVSTLSLIGLSGASPQTGSPTRQKTTITTGQRPQITLQRTVSTQQRINRFFHGDVMPKLKNCWSNVKGKGRISLKYTYTKKGGRWFLSRLETKQSTLPTGQDAVAQKCMLEAVRGSSFAVEADESTQNTFELNWTWPIPFPANAALLTRSMFAAKPNSGGSEDENCDGWGTPAYCWACISSNPPRCVKVCVGAPRCTEQVNGDCSMEGKCASGGPFSVSGGTTIF
ncbi:MAG TPA: hypothetical protein VGQ39_21700 [Pyrinomonadaceae bacterium]|jgi:hypothetical protein|nr:hypothetical protein [Pyrinomonadaceae bacterium]